MIQALIRAVVIAGVVLAAAYGHLLHPRVARWGATDEEVGRTLPGDDLVPRPRYLVTHAVTVGAPAGAIWPWLVQMGQGRGGLYSYTSLENLVGCDLRNARRIIPEFQRLQPGDKVRLVPEDYVVPLHYEVAVVDRERVLVLRTPGSPAQNMDAGLPFGTWAFVLDPIDDRTARLIVRTRTDFKPTIAGWLGNKYALEPVHFIMQRKMLLTIKRQAERFGASPQERAVPRAA